VSEPVSGSSAFGAAGPALGYLAQVDYALLAALERMDEEDDFAVSIETLDDIVFHDAETDDATEKWQSKHTINSRRTLSDASVDWWKTLHNWIAEPGSGTERLVVLSVANAGHAAAHLRAGDDRDVAAAMTILERTARESTNDANSDYYTAFLDLTPADRTALLERVEIVDGVAGATDVQPQLERAVRKSVKPQRRPALVLRLRGWWQKRAIEHLDAVARGRHDRITAAEIEEQLLEIAETLRDENLPIDVLDMAEPSDQEVAENDRIFVAQLRLVAMSSARLRKCIYDHNRAFAQRSIWLRDPWWRSESYANTTTSSRKRGIASSCRPATTTDRLTSRSSRSASFSLLLRRPGRRPSLLENIERNAPVPAGWRLRQKGYGGS
jgi:hypothetical protein